MSDPGYALGQLARVLRTRQTHPDPETRDRAEKKSESWMRVLDGMFRGLLKIGSRTPVAKVPGWATLEVVHGGFATGRLLAGGEWQEHELDLLRRLDLDPGVRNRSLLNSYFVSEQGFSELTERLDSGCYRIAVPEEGALLVVAWLSTHGPEGSARALLDQLLPFFEQLRFYPIPASQPPPPSDRVSLLTVAELREHLRHIPQPLDFMRMRIAVTEWTPCLDRVVGLFQETVEEGWPCQHFPADWAERAAQLQRDVQTLRQTHSDWKGRRSLRRLLNYLETCLKSPKLLKGIDVSRIRGLLQGIEAKRGLPGSQRLEKLRQEQRQEVLRPTRSELGKELAERLEPLDGESGLEDPQSVECPPRLAPLLQRVRLGTVQELMDWGLVASSEVLADLLPSLSATISASEFKDQQLNRLYLALYQAFRRRRSLLLLNLESQIKLRELPWIQALETFRAGDETTRAAARQCLEEVTTLALRRWPEVMLPNPLLQELRALATQAGLDLPLVEELAADIFMNQFTVKFLRAARLAARLLQGTLYERYYRIDYTSLLEMPEPPAPEKGAPAVPAFAGLCRIRAGLPPEPKGWGGVAESGRVIEQQQILTTQNLAVLYDTAAPRLKPWLEEMARQAFTFVCQNQQRKAPDWHSRLILHKNSAFGWRQMVFFAALLEPVRQATFLNWATDHLEKQHEAFRLEFAEILLGLLRAADGSQSDVDRPFLGWVSERAGASTT